MKINIILLLLIMASIRMAAQTGANLPIDKSGAITFAEVVPVPDATRELLFANAKSYLNSLVRSSRNIKKKSLLVYEDQFELHLPLHFTVYNEFPVKSPHGVIKYNLKLSVKDGRYRYLADNFVFHPLKRNRYGKFVEVAGKSKPMEAPFFKGNQKLWDRHKHTLLEKVNGLTEAIKTMMPLSDTSPEKEIVEVSDNW